MLGHVLSFKGKAGKVKKEIVEYNLFLIAHNGSAFDSHVVLNSLLMEKWCCFNQKRIWFLNNYKKVYAKQLDSKYEDYRDNTE